jgi:hypothetical protein
MYHQLYDDEGDSPEPPGRPTPSWEPHYRHRGQPHAKSQPDATDEPDSYAATNLHGSRDGKTRPQPVEKPKFYEVASERGPEHQQSGYGPTGNPTQPRREHGANGQRDDAVAYQRNVKWFPMRLPCRIVVKHE